MGPFSNHSSIPVSILLVYDKKNNSFDKSYIHIIMNKRRSTRSNINTILNNENSQDIYYFVIPLLAMFLGTSRLNMKKVANLSIRVNSLFYPPSTSRTLAVL